MTTKTKPKPAGERLSKRFADRAKARKAEYEAQLDKRAFEEAGGKPCDPDEAKEICDALDVSLEHFEARVRVWEDRLRADDDFARLDEASAAIAENDAEADSENRRHELAMQEIQSRREQPEAWLRAAQRAEVVLRRTQPAILTKAIHSVRREIYELGMVVDSHFALTDEERDVVRRPVSYDGNARVLGDDWTTWPGVDADTARRTIEAVEAREAEFRQQQAEARARIELLQRRVERLTGLALRFDVSERDIADATADDAMEPAEIEYQASL